ncbi:MAG: Ig-like domain-containing protein [Bacteroidetes bacterium]|nr:Ig-like domain-containing protein [Bacteroidota bacterium]
MVCGWACNRDDDSPPSGDFMQLVSATVGSQALKAGETVENVPVDQPVVVTFTAAVDLESASQNMSLKKQDGTAVSLDFSLSNNGKTVSAKPVSTLEQEATYQFEISNQLQGAENQSFPGISFSFKTLSQPLLVEEALVDGVDLQQLGKITDVSRMFTLTVRFSEEVDLGDFKNSLSILPGQATNFQVEYLDGDPTAFRITSLAPSPHLKLMNFRILSDLQSKNGKSFAGLYETFYTEIDETPKFPVISDDDLLTLVQQQTFKYFWDFGHPVSGLARERNSSGDLVTSGGSGFGLMALVVGMERGFITRAEGLARLETTLDFLGNADRFHGAWSHWLNGATGEVIPFSQKDNGGDLVETSYLVMGLLTVRQYLDPAVPQEQALISKINGLWQSVEWDWYRKGGQNALYWHWSPNYNWDINARITGYHEALITYLLAASSPTHGVPAVVYHEGWASNGGIVTGGNYYGYDLPLGPGFGGPLFFEQYTYLGLDPHNLTDTYANYWLQCVNHTQINRQYCIQNPKGFVAYSERCWGLTASDNSTGYSAHSPTNDLGVITPTAALSSFPYTPDYSMEALHFFYYTLGDRLWGEYGFYDAFNTTAGWTASSYLAIDQGPIIGMIENHRTGLLWDLFMSCPEVQAGLTELGFSF